MSTIKLWGRLSSINVQKVVWCLGELGLAYEHIPAGGAFGLVDEADYRRMNPNGLIPTIEDEGFVMWESNAIVRYLAAQYDDGTLWPVDPKIRASADRWMDWQTTTLTPAMRDAFVQWVRTPAEQRDPDLIERSVAASEKAVAILDDHLAEHAYMAGDTFTLADLVIGTAAHRWLHLPVDKVERAHIAHWYSGIRLRPAAASALLLPLT